MKITSKTTFAMTGVTGLLGRNVLLEILKNNYQNLANIEIVLLGRSTKSDSLHDRVMKIIAEEAFDYIDDPHIKHDEFLREVATKIECFDIQLGEPNLAISDDDLKKLSSKNIDFFMHIAALTDFRDGEIVCKTLEKINIVGTESILQLVAKLKIGEFSFVSSAYVCGLTFGNIEPDYINLNQEFRNYYEYTKLMAEISVREFCIKNNIEFKIFRPSTISGRLIEKQLGSVSKFDVFYGWGVFFVKQKLKAIKDTKQLFFKTVDLNLRFQASSKSGLNITPADFVAKIIYKSSVLKKNYIVCML